MKTLTKTLIGLGIAGALALTTGCSKFDINETVKYNGKDYLIQEGKGTICLRELPYEANSLTIYDTDKDGWPESYDRFSMGSLFPDAGPVNDQQVDLFREVTADFYAQRNVGEIHNDN